MNESSTASTPRRHEMWKFFGPAFVASVAYIDPGNFATNIQGGTQFGYRLLWVLLWSNAMAILVQYLSAKLGIVTGLTLPQNCRKYFSRPTTICLWAAAEIAAIATDLAEFLGAAIGLDLLFGPLLYAHGFSPQATLLIAALVTTVAVFGILALELAGHLWLERGIIGLVAVIGLCYGFEVVLVHPDWHRAFLATILPSLDRSSPKALHDSIYAAVAMLGATVMPHVVYLHSALVQPRLKQLTGSDVPSNLRVQAQTGEASRSRETREILSRFLHFELIDVFFAMNGAWLINSAMILMAAVAFAHTGNLQPTIQDAYRTLGPLFGRSAAIIFAVALLCSGLSSSTVGVMAGQVIIEGFLDIKFPILLRRLVTIIPALLVIGIGLDPLKILVLSQVVLSFALPFALIPLLLLTNRVSVMETFVSSTRTRIAGWIVVVIILALNGLLLSQIGL
ncbi:Nramp family divalent metal transporter [Granulicella tundricola]|uniref:Mn2+/Fe2+ transporter, NRAMP family n=1 Tax=Granulicella tundricola (strain ATCC BAA-1859 / DSM 23138 / MP5ACTX9) TaxID=1198114 RepID=E8X3D6_GRATM|nr:Nramp family divalent metal transporter [Granulicella tundricola]ADW70437.1 Mn2+/Fe2+ transporter, NRAMP family [Granulicella tundricola MP5ACTX9]